MGSTREGVERDVLLLLYVALLSFGLDGFVDPDLPGHLTFGRDTLAAGHLEGRNAYSYSVADHPWYNHEWAFEVGIAWLLATFGTPALVLLQAAGWGATGALVLDLGRRQTRDFLGRALVFVLFAALCFGSITIRPQLFTFLSFALQLWLLERARGDARWLLALPPLYLAWVNLHGGFLAGLGVLGLHAGGELVDGALRREAPLRRRGGLTLGALAASVLATGVNPYGFGLYADLARELSVPRGELIREWRGAELDADGVILLATALLAVVAHAARRERPLAHVLALGVTLALACRHVRHTPFFALCVAAYSPAAVAELVRRVVPRPEGDVSPRTRRALRWLCLAVGVPALAVRLGWPPGAGLALRLGPDTRWPAPTGALAFLDAAPVRGNLLCFFDWSQLVLWRCGPRVRVFYDGRFRTAYPLDVERAYFDFVHARPGWRAAVDAYPTEWVLVPPGVPVTAELLALPGWRVAYRDRQAVLFARWAEGGPAPPPVIGADPAPTERFR